MDLLQFIKMVSISRWVKFFSLTFVMMFLGFATYLAYTGFLTKEVTTLQSGTNLLGVTLPIFVIIVFLSFYESGIAPLKKATQGLLTRTIPDSLRLLQEPKAKTAGRTRITTSLNKGCSCLYRIILPNQLELYMRIEINVRKATVVYYLEKTKLDKNYKPSDIESMLLPGTIGGALSEGYDFLRDFSQREIQSKSYFSLVFYKKLPGDFLWNSAEKLYFIQDLLFFTESLIDEAGVRILSPTREP